MCAAGHYDAADPVAVAELELSAITEEEEPHPPTVSLAVVNAASRAPEDDDDEKMAALSALSWTNEELTFAQTAGEQVVALDDTETGNSYTIEEDTKDVRRRDESASRAAEDAVSSDDDVEETMLIDPEPVLQAVARDEPVAVPERAGGAFEADDEDDDLPRDALANLIDIQKTMATLQALTKMDARGLPLKPRLSTVVESPVAQPHSAGRVPLARVPQNMPHTRSHDDLFDARASVARDRRVMMHFTAVDHVESETESKSEEAAARLQPTEVVGRVRGEDFQYERDIRRPGAKLPAQVDRSTPRVRRQSDHPPKRGVEQSGEPDWIRVEREFQGIVRESQARGQQSHLSSSDERASSTSAATGASVSRLVRASVTSADVLISEGAHDLEPRIPMRVKPADAAADAATLPHATGASRRNAFTVRLTAPLQQPSNVQPQEATDTHAARHGHSGVNDKRRYPGIGAYACYFLLAFTFVFGASGVLHAATTVRDTHNYHEALKTRVRVFETSISESYASVRKLEENYAVWSDYVRLLAEDDETHALSLLEALQSQVEQWQQEMQRDLAQFKQSLAVDVLDAALVPLLQNATAAADRDAHD